MSSKTFSDEPAAQVGASPPDSPTRRESQNDQRSRLAAQIILVLLGWTWLFNILIKKQSPVAAFFKVFDTISDDFVMGSLLTVSAGVGIMLVFSITKWYSQIVANIASFKILEDLVHTDLRAGRLRLFMHKLLLVRDQPQPARCCPERFSSVLLAFAFIYLMSCVYVVIFSEALFFVAWSAGVDLPITAANMLFMPTLALAIPFSARVMAFLRYPFAQDYADFMPGAVFVYLLVTALGFLFGSETQQFFLERVYQDPELWNAYLLNDVFLAFIPVFFEAVFWISELNRRDSGEVQAPQESSAQ